MNLETIYEQCAEAAYEACYRASCDFLEPHIRIAFARAAIETYLKLNPFWVKASDRMPTEEDADPYECVATYSHIAGFDLTRLDDLTPLDYWTSIKHLPPPPDPFTEWYAKQPSHITSLPKETVKEIYQSLTTTKP